MRKAILLSAILTAMTCHAQSTIEVGDGDFIADTLLHVTVGPGMQTTGIRLSGANSLNKSIVTNIFYTTVDLANPDLILKGLQALDTECASENLLNMGNRKNSQGRLQYIAGVNGDHANLNGTHKRTNGVTYIDGHLYNWGIGDYNWKQFESYVTVDDKKDITICKSVKLAIPVCLPSGRVYNVHINSERTEGSLVLYTPEFGQSTKTNPWCKECTLKLVEGSIIDCDAVFEVTSQPVGDCNGNEADGNMQIPSDGFVLSGVGMTVPMVAQLRIGDLIKMQKAKFTINGNRNTDVSTIVGGCPIIVDNGVPISAKECEKLNKTTAIQITPTARTAIGYNEDRSQMFMVVADSYKSNEHTSGEKAGYGSTSSGLDFEMLAKFMVYLGCHTATAMDGGGSSQLYNIGLGVCNIPYGLASYLRPVANGFFAANDSPGDNEIAAIEVFQKNVRLSSGQSFSPKVYGYNKYGVLVDTDITDFSLKVNPNLGSVTESSFLAGEKSATTVGIVSHGNLKCGVYLILNGGGAFESSGPEDIVIEVKAPYLNDIDAGYDETLAQDGENKTTSYYNLQGIKVECPAKGFYIAHDGVSAKKILLLP